MDKKKIRYFYNPDLRDKHEWNKDWIYSLLQYSGDIVVDSIDKPNRNDQPPEFDR
jgi:hypothetical protein